MTYSIYSTSDANGTEGKKRCIYDDVLKDFKHIYTFDYLVQFFEEKSRKYFSISVDEDEKYYQLRKQFPDDDDIEIDYSCCDNYFSVIQIVWVVRCLKLFHERGYDFKVIKISTERDGWIMKFELDFSNLTKEQVEIIYLNTFEQNQFDPRSFCG